MPPSRKSSDRTGTGANHGNVVYGRQSSCTTWRLVKIHLAHWGIDNQIAYNDRHWQYGARTTAKSRLGRAAHYGLAAI